MNIRKSLRRVVLIGGGFVIVSGIITGITGYWPIAMVGYAPVTYNAFKENFIMADHFYRSNIKITGEDERVVDAIEVQRDLQRITMEGLIEQILIDGELKNRYTPDDMDRLIANKVDGVDLRTKDMQKATELLYGLTPGQFKDLVLLPKAEQELLEGNIALQGGVFSEWLSGQKKEASVSVFVPSMYWDGSEVKLK